MSSEQRNNKIILKILACLMIVAGGIIGSLPIFYWDFLITYQFKPTVRPYYPLFYGSILVTGIIIVIFGFIGLIKKFNLENVSQNRKFISNLLPMVSICLAIALPIVLGDLYLTTSYLMADKLYSLILLGLILSIVLSIILMFSGIKAVVDIKKKKPSQQVIRLANTIPLILLLLGVTVAGVLFGPPDAECQPFPEDLPFQTPVYKQGDGGYHTFKIPTMITAPNGTILAFAEGRVSNQEDWDKMDMVLRKSYDGGTTWTPLEVIVEDGDKTIGNTCPVVDSSTGFIWVIFCKENDRCFKMHSEDNGTTWSTPIEITDSVKLDNWGWYATGPTHGIQLEDGTLVIPADHIEDRKMSAHVILSKDHGNTWELGGSIPGGEEASIVELKNNDLYINIRSVQPGYRLTAFSKDKGKTWTNISLDYSLPDPACQGNLIEMGNPNSPGESIYLFSNAADSLHREKMTVRISYDECNTWNESKILYSGMTSYSDLSVVNPMNNTIGCLFERGCNYYAEEIVFARFPLDYIKT
jgi:sialidase-1